MSTLCVHYVPFCILCRQNNVLNVSSILYLFCADFAVVQFVTGKIISQRNYCSCSLTVYLHAGYISVFCLINLELVVFLAQAESTMQQQLGELYSQVDTMQSRLYEADAKEQMLRAKLDNAEHEVFLQHM